MASSSITARPERSEFSDHYAPFIALVPDGDILAILATTGAQRDATIGGITNKVASLTPPEGKWNIRETLGHLADMERVLSYRALRIARADRAPVSGVDQNHYVANSYANQRSIADLRRELSALRVATITIFASTPRSLWPSLDVIEGDPVSLRALAYIIAGHDLHHLQQLADRFGIIVHPGFP